MGKLNPKLLPVAALILMVLALLMLATPLLRQATGFASNGTGFNRQFALQGTPMPGMTFPGGQGDQSTGQGYVMQGTPPSGFPSDGTVQGQGFPQTTTGRQFQGNGVFSLLRLGFLNGVTGTIVYTIALLLSLVAAIGMFMTKKWGRILGIIMAVLYMLVAIISLVPTILVSTFFRAGSSTNIILSVVHFMLAVAVIVFASIPPKKIVEVVSTPPPAAS